MPGPPVLSALYLLRLRYLVVSCILQTLGLCIGREEGRRNKAVAHQKGLLDNSIYFCSVYLPLVGSGCDKDSPVLGNAVCVQQERTG